LSQNLAPIERAMKELAALSPENQYLALIESEHTAALVRAMAAQDLHAIALAVGKEEALDLLPHCKGEQLVGLTDLSGWRGYRFDLVGFEDWLSAMFEAGEGTVANYLKSADTEQVLLYLNSRIRVHQADEEGDFQTLPNAVPGEALWYSPDRQFCLEIIDWLKDKDRLPADPIRPLLKTFESYDPFILSRMLAALRWELATPLEEDCLRLRNARMEEMGFPPLEEAVALYARGRPEQILARGKRQLLAGVHAPALTLRIRPRRDLLASGLAGLTDESRSHVLAELAYLANQSMVACGIPVGDPQRVQDQWTHLRATLGLALEFCARGLAGKSGDALAATSEVLRTTSCHALFRAGFNLSLPLQDLARRLQRDPRSGPGRQCQWLNPEMQSLVEGLTRAQPIQCLDDGAETPLERLSELQALALRLQSQIDVMAGVFEDSKQALALLDTPCEGTNFAQHSDLDLIGLQRTAEAHELLGGKRQLVPLPAEALKILRKELDEAHPVGRIVARASSAQFATPIWMVTES
jgi:hypothetical protein